MSVTQVPEGKTFELEPISPTTDDEKRVFELHRDFVIANTVGDHEFLEAHMIAGAKDLTWFNLNESNYIGVDHIVELWKFLAKAMGGKTAKCEIVEEKMEVVGDMAYVAYMLDFAADFGNLGAFVQFARTTEVWRKTDDGWKMVHFHCSNHTPGVMGGL
jgi:ketosteroid isomerase-like protein